MSSTLQNTGTKNLLARVWPFFALCILSFQISCSSSPYLYDKTGFDPQTAVQNPPDPNGPVRVAPDYYYRQPAYPQAYYYPPQPQPQQQQPYMQQGYAPQPYPAQAGSRFYSNPYAFQPNGYYPNYDADQYYVPPAYYNNIESRRAAPSAASNSVASAPTY